MGDKKASKASQHVPGAARADQKDPAPMVRLTAREREVIAAILDGATDKDMSTRFGVREQTVKNHLSRIFHKLGVANRLELALYAVHHRIFSGARHIRTGANGGPVAPPRHPK